MDILLLSIMTACRGFHGTPFSSFADTREARPVFNLLTPNPHARRVGKHRDCTPLVV